MPAPSLTYTLTNGQTADADQVMQNFNDLLNGYADGTKDLSISALTVAGIATFNGAVNLGNASGDDLTFTGSLASSIPIKTTNTYNIGSSTLGLASIYFGANTQTVRILPSASMSATWTLTLPVTAGSASYLMMTNGSGVSSWAQVVDASVATSAAVAVSKLANGTYGQMLKSGSSSPAWGWSNVTTISSADYTITNTDGYDIILVSTAGTSRTITLPAAAAGNSGRSITIKKIDSGTGWVNITGTVDGSSTSTFNVIKVQYGQGTIVSNGTAWYWLNEITETGSWTPVISFSTSNGTAALSSIATQFSRRGRIVHVTGYCTLTRGTGSGNLRITGLPYNTATTGGNSWVDAAAVTERVTSPANYSTIIGTVGTNSDMLTYQYRSVVSTAANQIVTSAEMVSTALNIYFNLHYQIEP